MTSAVATVVLGTASVGMAAVADQGIFGFGGSARRAVPAATTGPATTAAADTTTTAPVDPQVVTMYQDVYDVRVVATTAPEATAPPAADPAAAPAAPAPVAPTVAPSGGPTTTQPSSPPTTVRPEGVPADWPADKPIPPMPPDCQKPQLEDNGVWNCDH